MRINAVSVIMSDMKAQITINAGSVKALPSTFTVRDMNRNIAAVLEACRQHGQIIVRLRSGEQFVVMPMKESSTVEPEPDLDERIRQARERRRQHREKMQAMGVRRSATPEGIEHLNRIIAGKE